MRQCAAMGCRVLLLTLEKHRHADWPHDILAEVVYMPEGLNLEQVTNTVTYLGRSRKFERLVALDEFDMETAAHLREHMRIPGMGLTTTSHFRDKLAMRFEAQRAELRRGVPWSPTSRPSSTTTTSAPGWPACPPPGCSSPAPKPPPSASARSTTPSSYGALSTNSATAKATTSSSDSSPATSSTSTPSLTDRKVVFSAVHQYGQPAHAGHARGRRLHHPHRRPLQPRLAVS